MVPNLIISNQSYFKAFQLCKGIDEKNTPYLALSIELEIDLLTKDEALIQHIRNQGFTKIISLQEFLTQL